MLVYIDTNVGVLKGEVVDEATDRYKVKINDETIFVKKEICKICDDDFENIVPDLLENIEDYGDALSFDILSSFEHDPSLEYDESKEDKKENGVEVKMNLKEKILSKLNYKRIAEKVYDLLESDIEDRVLEQIDDDEIAKLLAQDYYDQFVTLAEDNIVESITSEIEYESISDEFYDLITNKLDC